MATLDAHARRRHFAVSAGHHSGVSTYKYQPAWLEPHPSKPRVFILHVEIGSDAVSALREMARRSFPPDQLPDPANMAGIMFMSLYRSVEGWDPPTPASDPKP